MVDWSNIISAVAPHANREIRDAVLDHVDQVFERRKITTIDGQADCLAHILVESAGLTRWEENLNYSAGRLCQVWPNRFNSVSASKYAHNPKALAIKVYGDRMGNRPGTEDGWTFRGMGLLQATGRDNIARLARVLGITPEECAERLTDPGHAFDCAVALYVMLGAAPFGQKGDIRNSTLRVNGGLNGLDERKAFRDKIKRLLSAHSHTYGVASISTEPDIDVSAAKIKRVQELLRDKGYWGAGKVDGVMGPATRAAIFHFQADHGLPTTGNVDEDTETMLWETGARPLPPERTGATVEDLRAKGSETIAEADSMDAQSKVALGAGGLTTVTGGLDILSSASDGVQKVKDASDGLTAAKEWLWAHWPAFVLLVVSAFVVYWAIQNRKSIKRVIQIRLNSHKDAKDMGR